MYIACTNVLKFNAHCTDIIMGLALNTFHCNILFHVKLSYHLSSLWILEWRMGNGISHYQLYPDCCTILCLWQLYRPFPSLTHLSNSKSEVIHRVDTRCPV